MQFRTIQIVAGLTAAAAFVLAFMAAGAAPAPAPRPFVCLLRVFPVSGRTRKITTPMEKVPMTAEGYRVLDDQLKQLKSVERPSVIAAISEAREHGDLSENAEYHAAKERQGWIEGQIAEIEDKISSAQVIDGSKLSGGQVKFGATVTVVDEDTEDEARYQIVGEHEADVKKGKVSIASPIARAMISKEVGDVVEVNTPGGVKAYEILKVEWKEDRDRRRKTPPASGVACFCGRLRS